MEATKEYVLSKIPTNWKEVIKFIQKRNDQDYYEEQKKYNELVIDEVFYGLRQYLVTINLTREVISFTDDLVISSSVENYLDDIDYKEWEEKLNQLKENISKYDFRLLDTGNGGNDDYVWYKVEIEVNKFTEEKLQKVTDLWSNYNEERRSFYDAD
ncbi:hypothetical protein [Metabacillus fastidiosus]|uniref:hypothetical protein n=1 Tax=Metabacillus fastidiosus TaxID=1458 RepID=UPI003D2E591C